MPMRNSGYVGRYVCRNTNCADMSLIATEISQPPRHCIECRVCGDRSILQCSVSVYQDRLKILEFKILIIALIF